MTDETPGIAPLLREITIEHGPPDLLGRLFLRAEEEVRRRGLTLSFGTFDELMQVNRANRATWLPMISTFDPDYCDLGPDRAFCIFGRNAAGDVVTTQAGRYWNLDASVYELYTSLKFFYDDPARHAAPGEACRVSVEATKSMRGRVAFTGGVWYRPDYRGLEMPRYLSRIARAYAYTRWNTDYSLGACSEAVMKTRMPQLVGHTNHAWSVETVKNPKVGDIRMALFWMNTQEMLGELSSFLSWLDQTSEGGVEDRGSEQNR